MKRFEFKLEALLNYKRHLEQIARRQMAEAHAAVTACELKIEDLYKDKKSVVTMLQSRVEEGISASEFQRHQRFLSGVEQTVKLEKKNKTALEKRLDEKRAALNKRIIDKKSIERLREKKANEYMQEMLRQEQKELDEICAIKTAREVLNGTA